MNTFEDRLEHYRKVAREKRMGIYHYIPFMDAFPKLASRFLPGIIPGIGYQIMANSGIGKSKLFRYMFMHTPYNFIKNHPDTGITFKVILNALEETPEEVKDNLLINRLRSQHGLSIDINKLNGFSDTALTEEELQLIALEQEYLADFEKHLIVVNQGNPFGFLKVVRAYAQSAGKFYDKYDNEIQCYDETGNNLRGKDQENWIRYKPNNPKEIVICASDHIWLYSKESKLNKYDTVAKFSANYSRQIMNMKLGYATVQIQQLESGKEKKEYYKGQSIVEKLEPSLDSGGDIKILQRDNLVTLGLFSPYRHKIPEYRGYEIKKFKDCIRFLFVLKNRRGREGLVDPLFFDGASETFEELPAAGTVELEQFYQKAKLLW